MSVQSMWMPAIAAIATRWMVWLVDPPVATRVAMAFTMARSSTISRHRPVVVALRGDLRGALGRRARQRGAQRRARIDEGGARQMQAHRLHQHLVASWPCHRRCRCPARDRMPTSARSNSVAPDLAFGIELPDARFLGVRQAARHRPARHEDHRQMAERERAHEQARHDLVADAERKGRVEHAVGQRHRGRQRDHVAAEQRQFHAGLALRDAVAHGGRAAGELRHGADLVRRLLDQRRIVAVRLMRRQHVVVGRDDPDIGRAIGRQRLLVVAVARGKAVRQVAAGQMRALRLLHRAPPACAPDSRARLSALLALIRSVTSWMAGCNWVMAALTRSRGIPDRPCGVTATLRSACRWRRPGLQRHRAFRPAGDRHQDQPRMEQRRDGQRQARDSRSAACPPPRTCRVVEIEPGLGLRQTRKQRGEMAVGSHAQQDHVQGPRYGIDRTLRVRNAGARPRRRRGRADGTAPIWPGRAARRWRTRCSLLSVWVARTQRSSVRPTCTFGQSSGSVRQAVEDRLRRRAAGHDQAGHAARGDAVVQQFRDLVRGLVGPALAVSVIGPADLGTNRWFLKHRLHAKSGHRARSARWRRLAPKSRLYRASPARSVAARIPGWNQSSARPPRPRPPA